MRTALLLAALFAPLVASAVPTTVTHTGRVMDSAGAALDGDHELTFAIFAEATGGVAVWTESLNLSLTNGYYSATLGEVTPLDAAQLDGRPLFIEISVDDGAPIGARLPIQSVPYAVRAGVADAAASVSGGLVNATSVQINGTTVIGADGKINFSAISDAPIDADSFAAYACDNGEALVGDDGGWSCAPLGAELDEAEVEALIENGPLSLDGSLQVAADDGACGTGKAGTIRWDGRLEVCTPAGWQAFHLVANGANAENAVASCAVIKANYPNAASGVYWLQNGAAPYEAWCDMTNAEGGWTLLLTANATGTTFGNNAPAWKTNANVGTLAPTGPANAEYRGPAYGGVPTNAIRLCYQDLTKCYTFQHNLGRTLQSFFVDNVTYTAFALDSFSHPNTGAISTRAAYLTAMGVTAPAMTCHWMGINDQNSISAIGLLGDGNGGCASLSGTYRHHDDFAFGVGLQSCNDNNSCEKGGTGHTNGVSRNVNSVDASGNLGPWFVFGR